MELPLYFLFVLGLPHNSYAVGSENLILNPPIIPKLIFFFILIALPLDIVLILCGEIMPRSLDHRS